MNTILKYFLLLGLLFFMLGCATKDEAFPASGIYGEWIWEQSIGGIGGWRFTPDSEMTTKKLIIDAFFYQEIVNDTLVGVTGYELKRYNGLQPEDALRLVMEFDGGGEKLVDIKGNELIIIDRCDDCFRHWYRKQ